MVGVDGMRGLAVVSVVAAGVKIVEEVGAKKTAVLLGPSEGAAMVCASLLPLARVTAVRRDNVTGVKTVCTDETHANVA